MYKADLRYNQYKKYGGILIFVKFVFYKELAPNLRKSYKESESTVFMSLKYKDVILSQTQQIKRTSRKGLINIAVAQFKILYNKHQEGN